MEYKLDTLTQKTKNVFIETVSVDPADDKKAKRDGWAYSSKADYLVYLCLGVGQGKGTIFVCKFGQLRQQLPLWKHCREGSASNNGYITRGLIIPLDEFRKIVLTEITLH